MGLSFRIIGLCDIHKLVPTKRFALNIFELGYVPQNSDGRVMLSIDELKKHLDENVVEGMVRKYIKQ